MMIWRRRAVPGTIATIARLSGCASTAGTITAVAVIVAVIVVAVVAAAAAEHGCSKEDTDAAIRARSRARRCRARASSAKERRHPVTSTLRTAQVVECCSEILAESPALTMVNRFCGRVKLTSHIMSA